MPEIMTPEELLEAIQHLPEDEILRVTFKEDSQERDGRERDEQTV